MELLAILNKRKWQTKGFAYQGRSNVIFSGQPTLEKYRYPPTIVPVVFELPPRNEELLKKCILKLKKKLLYSFPHFCQKIRQNRFTSKSRPAHGQAGLAFHYGPAVILGVKKAWHFKFLWQMRLKNSRIKKITSSIENSLLTYPEMLQQRKYLMSTKNIFTEFRYKIKVFKKC